MKSARTPEVNLETARALRKSGFLTTIHALPELKTWLDDQLFRGGKTIPTIYREAANTFTELKLPSEQAFRRYAEKHYQAPTIRVEGWQPEYLKHMKELEAYEQLIWWAKECKENYLACKNGNVRQQVSKGVWGDKLSQALNDLLGWEMKLGLRHEASVPPAGAPGTVNFNQQINNYGGPQVDPDKAQEIIEEGELVAEYLRNADGLAGRRNGATVRQPNEEIS